MVALPMWGSSVVRGDASTRWIHGRLPVEHVEAGGIDRARLEGVDQGILVHDRPTGRVDQHRRRLHPRQFSRADQMARRLTQRDVQAHNVRALEELVQRRDESGEAGVMASGVDDLHFEALRALGDRAGDAPEADQAERCPMDVPGQMRSEPPPGPSAFPQVALGIRRQTGGREDQEERQIRRRIVEHPGGVADRDTHRGCRNDVNVVVAHGRIGHDLEPPGPTGFQDGRVNAIGQMADDPVTFGGEIRQLPGRQGNAVLP